MSGVARDIQAYIIGRRLRELASCFWPVPTTAQITVQARLLSDDRQISNRKKGVADQRRQLAAQHARACT
jgi:hypothetical protein